MKKVELVELIKANQDDIVNFGSIESEFIPSQDRIIETEQILGAKLPPSYVWFLLNYGGGTVHGDEILSISKKYDEKDMSDIASVTLDYRRRNYLADHEIAFCLTDFGETFLMDTSRKSAEGEFIIVRELDGERKDVASDFIEFLIRYIKEEDFD